MAKTEFPRDQYTKMIQADTAAQEWGRRVDWLTHVIEKLDFWEEVRAPSSILAEHQRQALAFKACLAFNDLRVDIENVREYCALQRDEQQRVRSGAESALAAREKRGDE